MYHLKLFVLQNILTYKKKYYLFIYLFIYFPFFNFHFCISPFLIVKVKKAKPDELTSVRQMTYPESGKRLLLTYLYIHMLVYDMIMILFLFNKTVCLFVCLFVYLFIYLFIYSGNQKKERFDRYLRFFQ